MILPNQKGGTACPSHPIVRCRSLRLLAALAAMRGRLMIFQQPATHCAACSCIVEETSFPPYPSQDDTSFWQIEPLLLCKTCHAALTFQWAARVLPRLCWKRETYATASISTESLAGGGVTSTGPSSALSSSHTRSRFRRLASDSAGHWRRCRPGELV